MTICHFQKKSSIDNKPIQDKLIWYQRLQVNVKNVIRIHLNLWLFLVAWQIIIKDLADRINYPWIITLWCYELKKKSNMKFINFFWILSFFEIIAIK